MTSHLVNDPYDSPAEVEFDRTAETAAEASALRACRLLLHAENMILDALSEIRTAEEIVAGYVTDDHDAQARHYIERHVGIHAFIDTFADTLQTLEQRKPDRWTREPEEVATNNWAILMGKVSDCISDGDSIADIARDLDRIGPFASTATRWGDDLLGLKDVVYMASFLRDARRTVHDELERQRREARDAAA